MLKSRFTLYHGVVLGAYIVFFCNMIISYYHAWELFSRIGDYPGKLPHVAVIAFDTVFALCVLVISVGTMKKIKIGLPVWLAGLFGLGMTTWSNVRASMGPEWIFLVTGQWGKISSVGWESFIAGASTPTALVAIELLLAWMVANRFVFENETSEAPEPCTVQTEQSDQTPEPNTKQANHTPEKPETEHQTFEPDSIPDTIQADHTPYTEQTVHHTPKPATKREHAVQCALRLIGEGKKPSVRELAEIANCGNSTAQQALKILRNQQSNKQPKAFQKEVI